MSLVKINMPVGVPTLQTSRQVSAATPNPPLLVADANGQAVFDTTQVAETELLDAGCTYPVALSGTTGARPTAGLYPGMMYLDSTLGKPVWRNAANAGWIDATGASV